MPRRGGSLAASLASFATEGRRLRDARPQLGQRQRRPAERGEGLVHRERSRPRGRGEQRREELHDAQVCRGSPPRAIARRGPDGRARASHDGDDLGGLPGSSASTSPFSDAVREPLDRPIPSVRDVRRLHRHVAGRAARRRPAARRSTSAWVGRRRPLDPAYGSSPTGHGARPVRAVPNAAGVVTMGPCRPIAEHPDERQRRPRARAASSSTAAEHGSAVQPPPQAAERRRPPPWSPRTDCRVRRQVRVLVRTPPPPRARRQRLIRARKVERRDRRAEGRRHGVDRGACNTCRPELAASPPVTATSSHAAVANGAAPRELLRRPRPRRARAPAPATAPIVPRVGGGDRARRAAGSWRARSRRSPSSRRAAVIGTRKNWMSDRRKMGNRFPCASVGSDCTIRHVEE